MNHETDTRELFTLQALGLPVLGTHHRVCSDSQGRPGALQRLRTGVVIVNSLASTRAATGDSAVYWADCFASLGYPSFRIDQPGFGDSGGDPPPELLSFINTGGYGPVVAEIVREICTRYGLSGVVLVGLCAGAVSAIYSSEASQDCVGLILLDPYFHLPIKAPSWLWQKLTGRLSRSSAGQVFIKRSNKVLCKLNKNRLPANANGLLLRCWKGVTSRDLPILYLRTASARPRGENFDYLKYLTRQTHNKSKLVVKTIEGAGHTFSNLIGRNAVREHSQAWLEDVLLITATEARSAHSPHRIDKFTASTCTTA